MNKRTFFIILGAVLFALIVGLIWFWFFRTVPETLPTGSFGTGGNRPGQSTTPGSNGNQSSSVLNGGASGTNIAQPVGGSGGRGGSNGPISTSSTPGVGSVPGVDWLGGGGGNVSSFVPKTANQLNSGSVGGSPGLLGSYYGDDQSNNQLGLAVGGIFGAAAGCAAYSLFQGAGTATAGAEGAVGLTGAYVLVYDFNLNRKAATNEFKDIGDCLTRTIARAILQQMTASIVNWINSGFNGKPSFVTNYQQFFANVGDRAAGEFIRGTSLAFLCSPFQLQIRIAVAQSYAQRGAGSCTLTGVIKNINSFMAGNFSQGGWGGLIKFTTVPTNNPYGAFAYAQVGLVTAQSAATRDAQNNLSVGGFIGLRKEKPGTCKLDESTGKKYGCQYETATPGAVIENAMNTSQNASFRQLELAKSFDEIINALITQLMLKTLYQGYTSLSGSQGYGANYLTPEQQKAQKEATDLLTDMQGRLQVAQQYGQVEQGAIYDIQNTQQQLQGLLNCWETKGNTAQASSTESVRLSYDSQIDLYNQRITRANAGIAALQEFQSRIISINSAKDVEVIRAAYENAIASGDLISSADVTTAQQDRATLQASLTSRNAQTASELDQCYASQ